MMKGSPATAPGSIPMQIFEADLQAMKAEATRRRLIPLKDAIERCLSRRGEDVWHAMVIGADVLRGSKFGIACVSNLGKMATMKVLPLPQLSIACQVLRSQLDTADDELSLRMVQTVISFVSACEAQKTWLEAPLSFLLVLYLQCRTPMVQAACTASINQMSIALLDTLKTEASDPATLQTQMFAVEYFRDLCFLIGSQPVQWLKLEGSGPVTEGFQLLLLEVLTRYFTTTDSSKLVGCSPLLTQILNVDFVQLVIHTSDPSLCTTSEVYLRIHKLAVTVLQHAHGAMTPTVGMLLSHHEKMVADTTQPWRMAMIFSVWRKPLGDAKFLKELFFMHARGSASPPPSGNNSPSRDRESTATPTQEVGDHELREVGEPIMGLLTTMSTTMVAIFAAQKDGTQLHGMAARGSPTPMKAPVPHHVSSPQTPHGTVYHSYLENILGVGGQSGSGSSSTAMGGSAAGGQERERIGISNTSFTATSLPSPHQGYSSLASPEYVSLAVEVMTMIAQTLARLTERGKESQSPISGSGKLFRSEEMEYHAVQQIAPGILQCCRLALELLAGEDVIHAILKTCTHMVQCACVCGFSSFRDDFLKVLTYQLQPPPVLVSSGSLPASSNNRARSLSKSSSESSLEHSVGTSNLPSTADRPGPSMVAPPALVIQPTPNLAREGSQSNPSLTGMASQSNGSFVSASQMGRELSPPHAGRLAQAYSPVSAKAELIQQKIHILSTLVSIASAMGKSLQEGWSLVIDPLLNVEEVIPEHECSDVGLGHECSSLKAAILHFYGSTGYLDQIGLQFLVDATTQGLRIHSEATLLHSSQILFALCKAQYEERLLLVWESIQNSWKTIVEQPACPSVVADHLGALALHFVSSSAPPNLAEGQSTSSQTNRKPATVTNSPIAVITPPGQRTAGTGTGSFAVTLLLTTFQSAVAPNGAVFRQSLIRQIHKIIERCGAYCTGAVWRTILRILEVSTTFPEEETVLMAFRTMEILHHSWITNLNEEALSALLSCVGAFLQQRSASEKISVNLTAGQLAWAIADYMASLSSKDGVEADHSNSNQRKSISISPHHWCTLFAILRDGGMDDRPEIRQSSLKTLFSLMMAHGGRLPPTCWRACIWDVLIELMNCIIRQYGQLDGVVPIIAVAASKRDQPSHPLTASPTQTLTSSFGSNPNSASVTLSPSRPLQSPTLPQLEKQWVESHCSIVESCSRIIRSFYKAIILDVPDFETDGMVSVVGFLCRSMDPADLGRNEETVTHTIKAIQAMIISLQSQLSGSMIESIWSGLERTALAAPTYPSAGMNALTLVAEVCRELALKQSGTAPAGQPPANSSTTSGTTFYMVRLFPIFEGIFNSKAVDNTFMYPCKAQLAVMDSLRALYPVLAQESQWQLVKDLLLSQMPLKETIVNAVDSATTTATVLAVRKLRLGFLAKLCEEWGFILTHYVVTDSAAKPGASPKPLPTQSHLNMEWILPQVLRAVSALLHLSFIQDPGVDLVGIKEATQAALATSVLLFDKLSDVAKPSDEALAAIAEAVGGIAQHAQQTFAHQSSAATGKGPQQQSLRVVDEIVFTQLFDQLNEFLLKWKSRQIGGSHSGPSASSKVPGVLLKQLVGPSTSTLPQCQLIATRAADLLLRFGSGAPQPIQTLSNATPQSQGTNPQDEKPPSHRRTISAPLDPSQRVTTPPPQSPGGHSTRVDPTEGLYSALHLRHTTIIQQYLSSQGDVATRALLVETLRQIIENLTPLPPPSRATATGGLIIPQPGVSYSGGASSGTPVNAPGKPLTVSPVLLLMPHLVKLIAVENAEVRNLVQVLLRRACAELGLPDTVAA